MSKNVDIVNDSLFTHYYTGILNHIEANIIKHVSFKTLMAAWFNADFSKQCQPMDYSNDPNALRVGSCISIYFNFFFYDLCSFLANVIHINLTLW